MRKYHEYDPLCIPAGEYLVTEWGVVAWVEGHNKSMWAHLPDFYDDNIHIEGIVRTKKRRMRADIFASPPMVEHI